MTMREVKHKAGTLVERHPGVVLSIAFPVLTWVFGAGVIYANFKSQTERIDAIEGTLHEVQLVQNRLDKDVTSRLLAIETDIKWIRATLEKK